MQDKKLYLSLGSAKVHQKVPHCPIAVKCSDSIEQSVEVLSPQIVPSFFTRIMSYSLESSLAALLLCLSSP